MYSGGWLLPVNMLPVVETFLEKEHLQFHIWDEANNRLRGRAKQSHRVSLVDAVSSVYSSTLLLQGVTGLTAVQTVQMYSQWRPCSAFLRVRIANFGLHAYHSCQNVFIR